MPHRRPSHIQRAAALGTAVALLAWLGSPLQIDGAFGVRAATAQDRPSVAVVGVHGSGDQDKETLFAVDKSVFEGFKIAARYDVLSVEDLRERFMPARAQLLESVFLGAGRDAFQEGRIHYEAARFDQAIQALQRAESEVIGGTEFLHDQRLLVDVQLYIGLSYASMGQRDEAREAYGEVLRMAPDRVLDTLEYSPKIVALFDDVRDQVLSRDPATLIVDAPAGAQVFLDGRRVGAGSTTLPNLPPGFHTVLVESDVDGRWFGELTLEAGTEETIDPDLTPRGLGRGDDPYEGTRSRLVRRLYQEVARVTGTDLVAIAAYDEDGNFSLALYSARSDTFSESLSASLRASPGARDAFVKQLVERVAIYADTTGAIKSERVTANTPPLRLGANPVLNSLLFGAAPVVVAEVAVDERPEARTRKPVKPGAVIGVILGILGAGGAATGVYFAVRPKVEASGTFSIAIP
jgi:tetratricopeptide (TPR) repeat protein